MKTISALLFLAVVVGSQAEADSFWPFYNAYAPVHGYNYNFGYNLKSAPCVNAANVPVPCNHGIYKREAEADSAYFVNPYFYGNLYNHGLVHTSNFGICVNYLGARVPC